MIKDRSGNIIAQDSAQGGALDFLYGNAFGRLITKLLSRKFISELGRIYMNSSLSKRRINNIQALVPKRSEGLTSYTHNCN